MALASRSIASLMDWAPDRGGNEHVGNGEQSQPEPATRTAKHARLLLHFRAAPLLMGRACPLLLRGARRDQVQWEMPHDRAHRQRTLPLFRRGARDAPPHDPALPRRQGAAGGGCLGGAGLRAARSPARDGIAGPARHALCARVWRRRGSIRWPMPCWAKNSAAPPTAASRSPCWCTPTWPRRICSMAAMPDSSSAGCRTSPPAARSRPWP